LFVDRYYRYRGVTEYDVFPDKQHFLMVRSIHNAGGDGGVSVIVNWPRLLEKASAEKAR
jgi:hypothetical protein